MASRIGSPIAVAGRRIRRTRGKALRLTATAWQDTGEGNRRPATSDRAANDAQHVD